MKIPAGCSSAQLVLLACVCVVVAGLFVIDVDTVADMKSSLKSTSIITIKQQRLLSSPSQRLMEGRGKRCLPGQAKNISKNDPVHHSNCPDSSSWIHQHFAASLGRSSSLLVFVGCNKGYDLITAARQWGNNASFKTSDVFKEHNKRSGELHFGACNAAKKGDVPVNGSLSMRRVLAYCIEPMPANVKILNNAFSALSYAPPVIVVHAAVSSTIGAASFPNGKSGAEALGMNANADMSADTNISTTVKVTTLDELLLPALQVDSNGGIIDWLSIDTEGNDMRVLFGSVGILGERRVRYLEFEYHAVHKWASSNLEDLVDLLDQFGFDCYFPGNRGQLWRLTGCWDDSYNKKTWSNVVCPHRSEVRLTDFMEKIAIANHASHS
jgi:FkbM family methyltransferase